MCTLKLELGMNESLYIVLIIASVIEQVHVNQVCRLKTIEFKYLIKKMAQDYNHSYS